MTEKNILLGNGINIEFSNTDEYKNYAILQRMCNNMAESNRYDEVFAGKVSTSDMSDFMINLNEWFKNHALKGIEALKLYENEDELHALLEMSKRYSKNDPDVLSIGLEDYLLGLKLFNAQYGDEALDYNTLYQGITLLMLDAIYNDGKIQTLYKNMLPFKDELKSFSKIFTLNYDTNIDMLLEHPVYHLHGSFTTLHHEYRADTFKGWAILQSGKSLPTYIPSKEYLYCDALFGFSGKDKLKRINEYNSAYTNPKLLYFIQKHPELQTPAYPIEDFKRISGDLYIIGFSPNNDSHIFDLINGNTKIRRVIYYSASIEDSSKIQTVINKPVEIRNVFKYWKKIRQK